jgi:hypothetical protein
MQNLVTDHVEGRENRWSLIWSLLNLEQLCVAYFWFYSVDHARALDLAYIMMTETAVVRLLHPVRYATAIEDAARVVAKNWQLALIMARRDLASRYSSQLIGSFWIIGHPLFQRLLYVFLFAIVFKQRIGGTHELPRDYTVYILSGLIAWLSILPALTAACISITSNAPLVKQRNLKLEILPCE